jgi:glycosyltransferase involved in cell wall biosynthesis
MSARPLRVVLTTESYLPYVSGVTVSVDAIARGLGAQGHEVLVVAPRPADRTSLPDVGSPGPAPRHAWLASYQLPGIVPAGYRMAWPNPGSDGWAAARAFEPEIVHAHSPFVTGLGARRLARRVAAPLVFTHHTRFTDYRHYLGPLAGPGAAVTDAFLRRYWAGCAAIIAPGSDLADDIRQRLPAERRERVHVIPTGIDVAGIGSLERVDPRGATAWPSDAPVVGTLGRLAPEKSTHEILEAVARLPSMRLLVIGGGPSEEALRRRAEAPDLAGRVDFTGALPRTEALARLGGADAFAFASRTETQGLVLAEALSLGLPAVAVDGPGVRDSVRDGVDGIIVDAEPAGSIAERLATALAEMLGDAARRDAMAASARRDAGRFSVEARVAQVVALYRQLLGR